MNLYGKEPCTHMDLNINSPAYFGEHYGVDGDVCRFCQTAAAFFKDKEYSSSLHIIGITPACAPQSVRQRIVERIRAFNWRQGMRNHHHSNGFQPILQGRQW